MKKSTSKRRGSTSLGGGLVGLLLLLALAVGCASDPAPDTPSRSVTAAMVEPASLMPTAAPTETPEPTATPEPTPTPTATPEPPPTPEPTATPYRIHGRAAAMTVYVSRNNVIHFKSNCSGMKYYTEMTLEQADAAGYKYCEHCS